MRENWRRPDERSAPTLELVRSVVGRLAPAWQVRGSSLLGGGLANCNLRLELDGPPGLAVLRWWQRRPAVAGVELAVLKRVAAMLPVPAVLAVGLDDPELGPCALLSWIDGQALQDLDDAQAAPLGEALGSALAAIHKVEFDGHGFLDADLAIATPLQAGGAGLLAFLRDRLTDGPGAARLGAALTAATLDFAASRAGLLDHRWARRACLTHADFNPSNVKLARDAAGLWHVTGVLDWEFAFAGGPAFDFAHVLRPPWGDRAEFVEGVACGYRTAGCELPAEWPRIAAVADLFAWADFLGRDKLDDTVATSARRMIARIIET